MPKPFKLINKYFSKEDNEWQWTYELKIIFNKNHITDFGIIGEVKWLTARSDQRKVYK